MTDPALTRRSVLAGAAAVGVTSAIVACGSDTGTSSAGGAANTGPATLKASEIPVGGGTVIAAQQVVVTQPTMGTYKAFSAVCTHQGCLVSGVQNSTIFCPCHNSQFSAADGSVVSGPANQALPARTVTLKGDTLTIS
jgi:Rieske Fe-S protein